MAKQTFTTGQVLTAAQMTSLQQTALGGGSTTAKTASYVLLAADAGTVVQMNSASATTITVNTALFAAGDTVQIQNVGAGVCTVTAGTATVSTAGSLALSQYEGGQLYFNSTSASIFFDIVQASSSSGMTLVKRASFSAVANTGTTFDTIFTTTYKEYIVVIETMYAATNTDVLQFQLRESGVTKTTTYYTSSFTNTAGLVNFTAVTGTGGNVSQQDLVTNSGASNPFAATFFFHTSFGKTSWNGLGVSTNNPFFVTTAGTNDTSGSYNGLLFKSSSSNITGTVAIYGLATA